MEFAKTTRAGAKLINTSLTHGSLFTGIGGFDLGFERAGIRTIWQVEQNEYCRRVLARNFPDADRSVADVRDVTDLPRVDIISGGFPCIDISRMGRRAGLSGEHSGLWREMVRAVRLVRPRYVVVENVAALLDGEMGTILGDLAGLGYLTEWRRIRSDWFGLRQTRERVFVLAYFDRWVGPQSYEWPWLHRKIQQATVTEPQPIPLGMRIDQRLSDRVDIGSRISKCANSVVPKIAEWIGQIIVEVDSQVSE